MSDYDDDPIPTPHANATGPVWSLAAFSAAVFLCSVLGAKLLSKMVDRDDLSSVAYDRTLRDAPRSGQATQVYSIVRSVGVDGITTATIPLHGPAPVSPCGDEKAKSKPAR